MNDILQLKGPFEQKSNTTKPGTPKLMSGKTVKVDTLIRLKEDLVEMIAFWEKQNLLSKALVSVYYNKIVAKSNRLSGLFTYKGIKANDTIVGAKFQDETSKHIITHYISIATIRDAIEKLNKTIDILNNEFNGHIGYKEFNEETFNIIDSLDFEPYDFNKSMFRQVIVDASFVDKFDVETTPFTANNPSIITLYKTDKEISKVLEAIGIRVYNERILDDTTILLDPNQLEVLLQKAPYLISMATEDLSAFEPGDFKKIDSNDSVYSLPDPTIEPIIGVIDTFFDERVYFSKWVKYHHEVSKDIPINPQDYKHGTAISSIIVDGPRLNPNLDDGCGRFKVRHFGVATNQGFSSFSIIKTIKRVVTSNPDIKVWNLSLGSNEEIQRNFISAEAAILDQIQFENDIIFVIAGTNKKISEADKKIGSPADSINGIVVNSVSLDNEPTKYSRKGRVLDFFTKPDVSYYGGSTDSYIKVCEPLGEALVSGTSYAAPWIARKLSYLIDILGFSREIAKAMIVDSAIGWQEIKNKEKKSFIGHGVVPIDIQNIVKSQADEIKFVVSGVSEKYDTYNYNFPVPMVSNQYPFLAKATLCYFPKCARNQGVDYTNTELDIYFGRIDDKNTIKSINKNQQSIDDGELHPLLEEEARKNFRKWDNVKHIQDEIKSRIVARKAYKSKLWGMSIKTKERLNSRDGVGIRFGVVVTLKEINGVNRIEDFIQQCSFRGWLVNRINVDTRVEIYQTANEEIKFE